MGRIRNAFCKTLFQLSEMFWKFDGMIDSHEHLLIVPISTDFMTEYAASLHESIQEKFEPFLNFFGFIDRTVLAIASTGDIAVQIAA